MLHPSSLRRTIVRITPQDLRALPAAFLQSRPKFDFLRECQTSEIFQINVNLDITSIFLYTTR